MHRKGLIPKAATTTEFFMYDRLGNLEEQK